MSLDVLGADECLGLDMSSFGSIFQSAGELAKGGVELAQKEKAAKELSASQQKDVDAAIAADITASKSVAVASLSTASDADKETAKLAVSNQDRAGGKLTADGQTKRAEAADKQLADATSKWQASPKDAFAAALVKAWQATANKAHNANITTKADEKARPSDRDSGGIGAFLQKPVVGPVKVWMAGIGAIGGGFLAKKYLLKK